MQGGDNPSPQVQRSHDAAPRCTYTADFYAALRPPHPPQRLICDSLHAFKGLHGSPGYLTNKDLRWEFEEVQELVLEERKQLLQGSALMGPDSLLAAYTYEQLPLPSQCMHPAAAAAAAAAAPTAAAAAETAGDCSRSGSTSPCPSSPAAWSTASTRSSRPNGDACSQSKDRASAHATTNTNNNSNSSSSSRDSASLETFPGCVQTSALMLDQRRAELLSRKESITAEEVFAAVRTITDPEHPYTLEQLMVVAPEYVKTRCSSCSRECTAAAADSNSSCQCDQQQQQQQQQQHWGRCRNLHVEITFRPTIPHCSQATLIGLLLLVKAQRVAAAAVACASAAVEVSIIAGTHASYFSINKQLRDKERVRAAAANPSLKQMIDNGLSNTDTWADVKDLLHY